MLRTGMNTQYPDRMLTRQNGSNGGGNPTGKSLLSGLMGGREPRYNRLLDKMAQSTILFKVPREWGIDENNVLFGTGFIAVAAGATATSTGAAPRDLILRQLVVVNNVLATDIDFTITAVTVEGNSTLLNAPVSGVLFSANSFHSPSWDLPVAGGTSVSVTIVNGSLAGQEFTPTFTID